MKIKLKVEKILEASYLDICIPVNYDDEDIPYDFPLRKNNTWCARICLQEAQILNWPPGKSGVMYMKVRDEGIYTLLDENMNIITEIYQDYVPNGLIPGDFGDYVNFEINELGIITNWPEHANLSQFETNH